MADTVQSILCIIDSHPEIKQAYNKRFDTPLESRLGYLAARGLKEITPYFLDSLHDKQTLLYDEAFKCPEGPKRDKFLKEADKIGEDTFILSNVLAHIPPEDLARFGRDVFLWVLSNYAYADELKEGLENYAAQNLGLNKDVFNKARNIRWEATTDRRISSVKPLYELLIEFMDGNSGNVDLASIIRKCPGEGVKLGPERVTAYSMATATPKYGCGHDIRYGNMTKGDKEFHVFLDSYLGFILNHNSNPCAVISFGFDDPEIVKIYQLQGVRPLKVHEAGKKVDRKNSLRPLIPIDWERVMVEYTGEWAKQKGFRRFAIQSGRHNRWVQEKNDDGTPHLQLEKSSKKV